MSRTLGACFKYSALACAFLTSCALTAHSPAPVEQQTPAPAAFDFGGLDLLELAESLRAPTYSAVNPLSGESGLALAKSAARMAWAGGRPGAKIDPKFSTAKGEPSNFFEYGQGALAPAFHDASGVVFKALSPESGDGGAAGILRRLIAEHEKAQPPGWGKLVERVKQAWVDGGEKAMAAAADELINQTPYVDNTGGVYFSPKRFFERGGAVCKDFVNVKYLLLRDAGFPVGKMRIAALAPGAGGNYHAGHAVLLVSLEGMAEPHVLDLPNPMSFNQDLATRKESMAQRMARMRAGGPEDAEPNPKLGNMVPLPRFNLTPYGGARGLLMVSNEFGSRHFTMQRPPLESYEQLWTAVDQSAKAVKGREGVWLLSWARSNAGGYRLYRRMGERQAEQERLLAEKTSAKGKSAGQG